MKCSVEFVCDVAGDNMKPSSRELLRCFESDAAIRTGDQSHALRIIGIMLFRTFLVTADQLPAFNPTDFNFYRT
jgi:hypothetical protein